MAEINLDVLIPHYNDIDGLKISLNSVQQQSWPHSMRVVIADDGSTNEVYRQLERLAGDSQLNIVLVQNTENRGRPYTRNVLLSHIDSPLVTWLDAGDEWFPNKNTEQLKALKEGGHQDAFCWVTCNYDWKWEGKGAKHCRQVVDGDAINLLLSGKDLRAYLWTLMAPADSFKKVGLFDEKLPRLQDLDYFLRFVSLGGEIIVPENDEALCVYHKSDIGRNARQIRDCNRYIFAKHYNLYSQYGNDFIKNRKYDMELLSARYAFNNSERLSTLYYLARAFIHRPKALIGRMYRKGLRL